MPNDDLVLNQARQQKVVAALSTTSTTATTTAAPTVSKPVVVPRHPKSFSTGNIDQTGLEVVQIEFNFDGK
jgi:hypothetical protein